MRSKDAKIVDFALTDRSVEEDDPAEEAVSEGDAGEAQPSEASADKEDGGEEIE